MSTVEFYQAITDIIIISAAALGWVYVLLIFAKQKPCKSRRWNVLNEWEKMNQAKKRSEDWRKLSIFYRFTSKIWMQKCKIQCTKTLNKQTNKHIPKWCSQRKMKLIQHYHRHQQFEETECEKQHLSFSTQKRNEMNFSFACTKTFRTHLDCMLFVYAFECFFLLDHQFKVPLSFSLCKWWIYWPFSIRKVDWKFFAAFDYITHTQILLGRNRKW